MWIQIAKTATTAAIINDVITCVLIGLYFIDCPAISFRSLCGAR
nr:MAG TPA: hypothetical protein [Caudoviricetes sp.]